MGVPIGSPLEIGFVTSAFCRVLSCLNSQPPLFPFHDVVLDRVAVAEGSWGTKHSLEL